MTAASPLNFEELPGAAGNKAVEIDVVLRATNHVATKENFLILKIKTILILSKKIIHIFLT